MEPPYLGRRPPFMTQIRRTHLKGRRAVQQCGALANAAIVFDDKRSYRLLALRDCVSRAPRLQAGLYSPHA